LEIRALTVGAFAANCYIVSCPETGEAIVIDPGGNGPAILDVIAREGLQVKYVVNTHAHVDHIGANAEVKRATGAELLIHEDDARLLSSPAMSLALLSPVSVRKCPPDRKLSDGDEVAAGSVTLRVLHTPGHTPGSICLVADDAAFTGDTVFAEGIGRTDLPGGSQEALFRSIRERVLALPDDMKLYPGHGPATTVERLKAQNAYVRAIAAGGGVE